MWGVSAPLARLNEGSARARQKRGRDNLGHLDGDTRASEELRLHVRAGMRAAGRRGLHSEGVCAYTHAPAASVEQTGRRAPRACRQFTHTEGEQESQQVQRSTMECVSISPSLHHRPVRQYCTRLRDAPVESAASLNSGNAQPGSLQRPHVLALLPPGASLPARCAFA